MKFKNFEDLTPEDWLDTDILIPIWLMERDFNFTTSFYEGAVNYFDPLDFRNSALSKFPLFILCDPNEKWQDPKTFDDITKIGLLNIAATENG